ncbi:YpbS family protein [Metabacillus iocasae]|uniref:DUF2533 domain-containing protein n=1 Tax=Priestia iocasae TaxID=2291674 RepID=A0ABS2QUS8_9BACI|nr:YpbS family protein [Metabacillus iocasae]MBM7703254.1 hypothetical protein [Metabacillus iocasae]
MSVHKEISAHSQKQHQLVKTFAQLDMLREQYIERAVTKCQNNESFTTDEINIVTTQINELAKNGIVPTRKTVTKSMVEEYVSRLNQK